MPIIEARGLSKTFKVPIKSPGLWGALKHLVNSRYEQKVALHPLDLIITEGESVAYVGPNGAGKSTTLKLLSGILEPTAGEVSVKGISPHRHRLQNASNIGVIFGQRTQLWWDLPVRESLRLLGDIYRVPGDLFRRNLEELTELFELAPLLGTPTRQLSLGQRMRCDLAAALLHSPSILFLDEPTIGLDIVVKQRMWQLIQRRHREGLTLLLTSHDMGDVEQMCGRVVMIDQGKVAFDGALSSIQERFGKERSIHFVLSEGAEGAAAQAVRALGELSAVCSVAESSPFALCVRFSTDQVTAGAIASRIMGALPVHDLRIEEPSVQSIISRMYQGSLGVEGDRP